MPTDAELEGFFEAAPPHVSELLETETHRVVEWLCACVRRATVSTDGGDFSRTPEDAMVAVAMSSSGDVLRRLTVSQLRRKEKRDIESLKRTLTGATLIVDASLGGLSNYGLLEAGVLTPAYAADDEHDWLNAGDSEPLADPTVRFRIRRCKGRAEIDPDDRWRFRFRFDTQVDPLGEATEWLVVEKWRQDNTTEEDRSVGKAQELGAHQSAAESKARELGRRLGLPPDHVALLATAARLHDEGKRADRWQRAFNAPRDGRMYGKTVGPLNVQRLEGYRHEFGSLTYAERDKAVGALPEPHRDLVLHLIAAHHGGARPVISTQACEDAPPSVLAERARDVALRFVRMQKRWGPWGLAWWESLLRAADQQASRENDQAEDTASEVGHE